jgi:hypothetical protein
MPTSLPCVRSIFFSFRIYNFFSTQIGDQDQPPFNHRIRRIRKTSAFEFAARKSLQASYSITPCLTDPLLRSEFSSQHRGRYMCGTVSRYDRNSQFLLCIVQPIFKANLIDGVQFRNIIYDKFLVVSVNFRLFNGERFQPASSTQILTIYSCQTLSQVL